MNPPRIAVFGGSTLVSAIAALGLESGDDGQIAVIDSMDEPALARASAVASHIPRVLVAPPERHAALRALGVDQARLVAGYEPALLGPALAALFPEHVRAPTRVVLVTGTRGGVGRTLLATNLARRLAQHERVCLIDTTGSGAAGWWFDVDIPSWSESEPLVEELSAEHLSIVGRDVANDLHVVGGGFKAPSEAVVAAMLRAAASAFDLVLLDAPAVFASQCAGLRPQADRVVVLSYEDPVSISALSSSSIAEEDWILASQSDARRLGARDVFRTLTRDEAAIVSAQNHRAAVGGRLGRAYDELAEILSIDHAT